MEITKTLIRDIVEAEYELQTFVEDEPMRPVPGAPARAKELASLEAHLRGAGLPFPPSYRSFLAVCNGIEGYRSYFSLLDVAGVMQTPPPTYARRYPVLARFIIGRGDSLEFLAFDSDGAVGEELAVVFVADDGEETRYSNFAEYLTRRLAQVRRALDRERADRKGLKKKSK
jgi:hypothetical protein